MIGLTGAHRTGKSTVAKDFAEQNDIAFLQSQASQAFKDLGVDVKQDTPFDQRLAVQHEILCRFEEDAKKLRSAFISDRTPLDFLAYTLADVQKETLTEQQEHALGGFAFRCHAVANDLFKAIIVIPPGIPYMDEPGKPPPSAAYQEHIHALINGLVFDSRLGGDVDRVGLPRIMTGHEDRLNVVGNVFERLMGDIHAEIATTGRH
jgi:hypothetical protein